MLNQIVIVGRLTSNPEVVKSENGGSDRSQITLAVPRSYKTLMEHMILILLIVFFGVVLLKIQQNTVKKVT